MNPKIQKLREEFQKNTDKINSLKARNKEIEKKITELENTDIVGMVRAQGLTLEQFAELLHGRQPNQPTNFEKEEPSHEET